MSQHTRLRAGGIVALVALGAAILAAAPASAAVEPYGTHDAGGFRNVLPPGEDGVDNAAEFAAYQAAGTYPDHWMDQQSLYNGLIYAAPNLTNADISDFYKDATFGVKAGEVESTITPKPGVTIVRDSGYGVPHVYGDTRSDVMFGAGYANAADRLFLMDILRATGRAELSSFIGGDEGNREMDHLQWQLAPYTDAELERQFNLADEFYGKEGRKLQRDGQAYIAGINAYVDDALSNPALLPAEYAALGKMPEQWSTSDLIAEASLIGGVFGRGGGKEVDSAEALQALVKRFGRRSGRRAWSDFRAKNDPEAPTTVLGRRFPYQTTNSFSKRGLAIPDPGSVTVSTVVPTIEDRQPAERSLGSVGDQLLQAFSEGFHASNWELVSARESRTGHPIGVLGPQVGYYLPQILMELDLHGPGVDARGATFPGVGLYVLLGHGRDYAWSATTATSDNTDTFAEVLCRDDFHYIWRGKCRAMDKLVRENSWTPSGVDMTPPGSETLTVYRTVHGIVFARGTVDGRKVAFASARTTYGHEADSALFFARMNDPNLMRNGPKSFRAAAELMNFAFNWSYIDSKHIAYQLTGWYPQRARGTSPDFPILGTGQFDWKGLNPKRYEADWLPQNRLPHAVDQRYLVSWNNKQAPGWAAADDIWAYGDLHRSQMISEKVAAGTRGARKMTLAQLVQAMEGPATQDIRGYRVLPLLVRVIGDPKTSELRNALATLRAWHQAGSHRRDLDKNGTYEHETAVEVMDAWWPLLVRSAFEPTLGKTAFERVEHMLALGDHTRGAPGAPSFFDGWWGYVTKDLRKLLGGRVPGWSRTYCGGGSRAKCRAALISSLRAALKVTPEQLYAFGDCEDDPQPACFDRNFSVIASGLGIEGQPFQNRPTFQQTVSVLRNIR